MTAAIQVESLGKLYRIGERQSYFTLRDRLSNLLRAPARLFGGAAGSSQKKKQIWALRDVTFGVQEGEVIGLIGRNGAGKSTLLRILSRVTAPTTGWAEIRGRVGSLLEVGTGFHPELTGRENVYLNGAILGMGKREIQRKFDEIVAFAEVADFIDTPIKHYSTGMQMRLAFAVAAHFEPEILLVDEVLAVGDAAFQQKCLGKMGDVAREGRTILFVSHNMTATRSLCSRGYVLESGRIAYSGPVGDCIDQYLAGGGGHLLTDVITADIARPSVVAHDSSMRFTRIRLESARDQAVFYSGQPLRVIMDFEVQQPLNDVVIGLAVHSADGLRLFECRSLDAGEPIRELHPGAYGITCTLRDNPLNPGLYRLSVGSRCGSKGLDWLPDVLTFHVELRDKLGSVWLEEHSGLIRQASEWSLPVPCQTEISK